MTDETIISSVAELLAAYATGRRDFHGADLTGADLTGAYLTGAYLTGADLRGADLTVAYLTGADLRGANLSGADLTGANLTRAYLTRANLSGADLRGATLYRADLRGADLTGAYLRGANLTVAYLTGADLRRADLRGADLTGADLTGAKNPPASSHDFLAEALRQAAGGDVARRSLAGLVLVSRDWCWEDFRTVSRTWAPDLRAWVVATLGVWPDLREAMSDYGIATDTDTTSDNETADETVADGQQAGAGDTPTPQEAAAQAEWMEDAEMREADRKRNANAAAIADGMAPPYPSEY